MLVAALGAVYHRSIHRTTEGTMLWTIFVILLVLWALGMVSSYTLGGFIHLLLVIAIAVVLIRIIQGRRPV
jgi:asparagine N-glycosylation enzyme membrane subunit Stt3